MRGVKKREDQKWKNIAIFAALFLLFLVMLNSLRHVYQKKVEADRALRQMKDQLAELQTRENFLEGDIARLKTREGLEYEIKKNLNVAASGESVAVIVSPQDTAAAPAVKKTFWQKTSDFFKWLFE